MGFNGSFDVYDWKDQITGLTVRVVQFEPSLSGKLFMQKRLAASSALARKALDDFNRKMLVQMELGVWPKPDEAPLYHWVRAMKLRNGLSFEDGEYEIPQTLAACIVRCPGARHFISMLE